MSSSANRLLRAVLPLVCAATFFASTPMPQIPAISATASRRRRPRLPAGISTSTATMVPGCRAGKGTVDHGADVFRASCAACHGTFGEGEGRYPEAHGRRRHLDRANARTERRQLLAVCADAVRLYKPRHAAVGAALTVGG